MPQPLQPRRPFDSPQALRYVGGFNRETGEMLDRGDGEPGIVELVAAGQRRQREIERRAAGITETALAWLYLPLVAGAEERRPYRGGAILDSGCGIRWLRTDHRRNATPENSRLLAGDLG